MITSIFLHIDTHRSERLPSSEHLNDKIKFLFPDIFIDQYEFFFISGVYLFFLLCYILIILTSDTHFVLKKILSPPLDSKIQKIYNKLGFGLLLKYIRERPLEKTMVVLYLEDFKVFVSSISLILLMQIVIYFFFKYVFKIIILLIQKIISYYVKNSINKIW